MIQTLCKIHKMLSFLRENKPKIKQCKDLEAEGKLKERDSIVQKLVPLWGKNVVETAGGSVEIIGNENIPTDTAVVFIANHQGYMDIPSILGWVKKPTAFISKIEIKKIKSISIWMEQMHCLFMDRKDMRQSVRTMREAVTTVKNGYSLVIFPEGTRSKGAPIREFKSGSFKLAFNAEVPIIPITIDGSWRLYEEHKRLRSGKIKLTVHPPVNTKGLTKEEKHAIPSKIQSIIESALPEESLRNKAEVARIEKKRKKKEEKDEKKALRTSKKRKK